MTDDHEETVNKLSRIAVPGLLSIIGFGLAVWLNALSGTLHEHGEKFDRIEATTSATSTNVQVITTRLDAQVLPEMQDMRDTMKTEKAARDAETLSVKARLEVLENQRSLK